MQDPTIIKGLFTYDVRPPGGYTSWWPSLSSLGGFNGFAPGG